MKPRTFNIEQSVAFSDTSAQVREIVVTSASRIAVWGVRPGQSVPAHRHPNGQDTWIVLQGELTYLLGNGLRQVIRAGDLDVADTNEVHGAVNEGVEDAIFLSIYSSPEIGWEKAEP